MEQIKDFPHKDIVEKWLKAGYVDNNVFHGTEFGSGQGSLISPVLANIALMGMEKTLGISETFAMMQGSNANALIGKLNPIVIGIANYWSPWVAKLSYIKVDHHTWKCSMRFLKKLHPKKSGKWIYERYFKADKTGQSKNRWILTDPIENGQLKKMSWTPIVRHPLIQYKATPFNAELEEYYKDRDKKEFRRCAIGSRQKMAFNQKYKCTICGESITDFSEKLKVKLKIPEPQGGTREYKNMELVHRGCCSQFYKEFPEKGKMPTIMEIRECYKDIRRMKLTIQSSVRQL